jgi:hypothetical protein
MLGKILFASAFVAVGTVMACSSDTLAPTCSISGVYKLHYDLVGGSSASCKPVDDSTYDSASLDGGINNCSVVRDNSACTVGLTCQYSVLGYTLNISGTANFTGNGSTGTGKAEVKTTKDNDGGVSSDCNYNLTYTRQ